MGSGTNLTLSRVILQGSFLQILVVKTGASPPIQVVQLTN